MLNRRHRVADLPDPATEWMFYQTLVGAWPITSDRALAFLEKAVREANCTPVGTTPNQIYENAVTTLPRRACAHAGFMAEVG